MTFDPENMTPPGAKIKVIGVGGGGGNAVNTMIRSGLDGVDFITANTDVQALRYSLANHKLQIGKELTRGLGAGADPDIGRDAALEDKCAIQEMLKDADMVFITAGMGGGTGTGGAAVVAQIARELGALTVAVVTKPFIFEGKRRRKQAESGITRLRESVDTLITIPNQRLLQVASPELSMIDAFKMADEVLVNAVRGISDIINIHGMLNVDFADVKTVMSCMGQALMGIGSGRGEKRALEAALMAISSPLLEEVDIEGATGILINITGGSRVTMHEINEACGVIQEAAHEDANIIFGAVIDESLGDELRVTVIATGFPIEKSDDDTDPTKGKPFPSNVANRLANAAAIKKPLDEPKKVEPSQEPGASNKDLTVEIDELPQSPFDDLTFKDSAQDPPIPILGNKDNISEPMIAEQTVPEPIVVSDHQLAPSSNKILSSAIIEKNKDILHADKFDSGEQVSNISLRNTEEVHELARWTLGFTSFGDPLAGEDIPNLASCTDDEKAGTAEEIFYVDQVGKNDFLSNEVKDATRDPSIPILESRLREADPTTNRDPEGIGPGSETQPSIYDPKDIFVDTVAQTFPKTRLSETLFNESLRELETPQETAPNLGPSGKHPESLFFQNISSEDLARKGATKDNTSPRPFLNMSEDLHLEEIDRQIDAALEMADQVRLKHLVDDDDNLEVPAFLRMSSKDINLE